MLERGGVATPKGATCCPKGFGVGAPPTPIGGVLVADPPKGATCCPKGFGAPPNPVGFGFCWSCCTAPNGEAAGAVDVPKILGDTRGGAAAGAPKIGLGCAPAKNGEEAMGGLETAGVPNAKEEVGTEAGAGAGVEVPKGEGEVEDAPKMGAGCAADCPKTNVG